MYIRAASFDDAGGIRAVYAPYVRDTIFTFEFQIPSEEDIRARLSRHAATQVWLVAEEKGELVGYAYSWPFEERDGYRFSVETSIFVRSGRLGRGVGRALYQSLLDELRKRGTRQAIARIALPNPQSQRLHERLGFRQVALFPRIGHKFDRWIDVGYWQLSL